MRVTDLGGILTAAVLRRSSWQRNSMPLSPMLERACHDDLGLRKFPIFVSDACCKVNTKERIVITREITI